MEMILGIPGFRRMASGRLRVRALARCLDGFAFRVSGCGFGVSSFGLTTRIFGGNPKPETRNPKLERLSFDKTKNILHHVFLPTKYHIRRCLPHRVEVCRDY